MRAGRLKHVITIQQRTLAQDAGGALAPAWVDVKTIRAEMRSPAGLERVQARIRARQADITPAMRVVWKGRIFQIVAVTDPDNLGVQQMLDCFEVVQPVRV